MYKIAWYACKLLFWLLNRLFVCLFVFLFVFFLLTFSLPSPSSDLKVPNIVKIRPCLFSERNN